MSTVLLVIQIRLLFIMINVIALNILCYLTLTASLTCLNETPLRVPKYYLIEKCRRSKLGAIARTNYASLSSCRRLAFEKKALAFNFSPREARLMNATHTKENYYTCEVLKCVEVSGGLSLVNDTQFDYYSIYAKPIPNINSTCVPSTGMFHILKNKFIYETAERACMNVSGKLPEAINEQQAESLSQLIVGAKLDNAYLGMRRHNTTQFFNTNGDSLDCTTYRAWAPGHPRKSYARFDCVVITRHKTWRSVSCKTPFPVICELVPGGPYKLGSIFSKLDDDAKNNNITSKLGTSKN